MSETLIENVAKAIAENEAEIDADMLHYRYESREDSYKALARIAIEAMPDPTMAMIDMGCAAWVDLYPGFEGEKPQPTAGDVAVAIYRAMISAALKEQTK